MEPPLEGSVLLGKLRVVRALGEGGAGQVYEVEHLLTRHRRALKVIRPELCASSEAVARLLREATAASRVRSPHLAETLDAGRLEDGRAFILMELVEGRSLRSVLAEGPIAVDRAVHLAQLLCEGLEAVHQAGLVHRDVKPDNLFVSGEGKAERVRILDFGLCKILSHVDPGTSEAITRDGAMTGTPAYMAPEQFEAGAVVDARTDLWAVGALLFEMVTGKRPFSGNTAAAIAAALHRTKAPSLAEAASDVPPALAALVARLLEKDPSARFESAALVKTALREITCAVDASAGQGAELRAGDVFEGRYEVRRLLGRGGMGAVFEVFDREEGAARALKVLAGARVRPDAIERMRREARTAREIDREHVAEVFTFGVSATTGQPYLVLELCEGDTLDRCIARDGRLSAEGALALLRPLSLALDAVHARGIVHRDVKPSNILLARGIEPTVKLLDFGIAKLQDDAEGDLTESNVILGTPLYMAPEQARRDTEVGPAADRYGLAHVAFTALAGQAYFHEDAAAGVLPLLGAIGRGITEPATARARQAGAELPPAFDAWFERATALEPELRYESATAQIDALERSFTAARRASSRLRWAYGLGALVAIPVGAFVIASLTSHPGAPAGEGIAEASPVGEPASSGESSANTSPTSAPVGESPRPLVPAVAASSQAAAALSPPLSASTPMEGAPRPGVRSTARSAEPPRPSAGVPPLRPDSMF